MAYNSQILIVEDDQSFAEFLKTILEEEGYSVRVFYRPEEALKELSRIKPKLVITDLKMPGIDGITFIDRAKAILPESAYIVITAFGTIPSAVEAIKKGAVDYVTKPLSSPDDFLSLVERVISSSEEKSPYRGVSVQEREKIPYEILFAGIENIYEAIKRVARTDTTLILYGETGTGKSAIARAVHEMSGKRGDFVEINCASIPESLVESELFGYEKGAFSGAVKQKRGKIEIAQDGTLFLDEIGELTPSVQAKFLRVLQDRTFERLGGLEPIRTNARFITATNRDLKRMVKEGKFREDLYFRLNVFPIYLPPLRDRKAHIIEIADFLIDRISQKIGIERKTLSSKGREFLMTYSFPGNIRELENLLERAMILSSGREIDFSSVTREDLSQDDHTATDIKSLERKAILDALKKSQGDKKRAAEILGISLRKLYYKLKEYGL